MDGRVMYSDDFIDSFGSELECVTDFVSNVADCFPVLGFYLGRGDDVSDVLYDLLHDAKLSCLALEHCLDMIRSYRKGFIDVVQEGGDSDAW